MELLDVTLMSLGRQMIDMRYSIEILILSTYLNMDRTFFTDSVEIYDFKCPYELFKASYTTRLISKAIFNLQSDKKPLNDFVILDYLEKNKAKFSQTQFLEIITASWVTYETMIKYINMLKDLTKEEELKNKLEGIL